MKLIRYILTLLLPFFGLIAPLYGQMVSQGDTLYGNEWISYDQEYLKIRVADDGIYRITAEQLIDAGAPLSQIDASDFRLYWLGKERMIHCNKEEGTLTPGDYLEFFGSKNRSQVDRFLFSDPDNQMLNPEYGLTTDTSTYYLTWSNVGNGLRFEAISNVLDGPLPPKKTWYLHQEKIILNQQHFKPYLNTDNVRYSTYAQAEGFSSREASSHNFTILTKDASSLGPNPRLHLKMTGSSPATQVSLKWNNQEFVDLLIQGNDFTGGAELVDTIIPLSLGLSDENTFIATTSDDSDEIRFGVISLSFPRMFKFDLQSSILIQVEEAREGIYLELEDFNHGGMPPIVYDLSAGTVSNGAIADGFIKINLPSGPNSRSLAIVHPDHVLPTQTISAVDFIDLSSSDAEFLIISNQKLYDDGQGKNWVEEYANYRRSDIGGNYRTQILEIQQLIDQFTYGIDMHPLSIKNFTNYVYKNWSSAKYLFLIGKGLEYAEARLFDGSLNYLPVYGIPGSDNLLTSRTESSMPLIPVGRLAARAPAQVQLYLDKIKVMEDQITNAPQTIADRGWMKRVLHLGGGVGQSEIGVLRDKLNEMGEILEENEIQSDVFSWSIQSQDVIDFNNDETVIDLINDGLIIKTYFGHGSIFTTQFNGFEDPQFLDNKDRYSVMLSLGCYTGNLFTSENSLGEANIFSEDRGAIIYMATSGLGFLSALDVFGKNWYSLVGGEFLNHGIGEINQRVLSDFDAVGTVGIKTLMQQLILHGDPAFRLSRLDGPDYTIDFESVSFDPPIINSIQDSFSIAFDFYNLGSKQNDSIQIDFFHELPSKNKVLLSSQKIKSTTFKQAINVVLPLLNGFDLRGINTLLVELNPDRSIDEFPEGSAYNNNSLMGSTGTIGIKIPIVNNGVSPVFPPNYSIWSEEKLELISSTADPLAVDQSYIIQIDTTMHFNSSVLQETTINQRGGLIKWSPAIVLDPMRVYYWRVSPDSSSQQTYLWSGSSFTYIPESPDGWCQSHYFQFLDGQSDGLVLNVDRRFSYQQNYNEIRILNARARGEQVTQFFYDGRQ
ncbi:MAG: hypothetical protein HKN76_05820, partial [Saprospiraceae bacterium]|nr:hypothetical protein [Saprospiraceae bacterium]